MTEIYCKPGSAWHTWQIAGQEWRKQNQAASTEQTELEAECFAGIPGWPDAGRSARYRAFLEGANSKHQH